MSWKDIARVLAKPTPIERIPSIYDRAVAEVEDALQVGHRVMDVFRSRLALFDQGHRYRTFDQVRMQELALSCCARNIYGEAFDGNENEIMQYNHWPDLRQFCAVCTPRRWGKSYALAMFICVYLITVRGCKMVIYSKSLRAAGNADGLMGLVRGFLESVFGITKNSHGMRITKNNDEHLFVQVAAGDVRELRSYPDGKNAYVIYSYPPYPIVYQNMPPIATLRSYFMPGFAVDIARPKRRDISLANRSWKC